MGSRGADSELGYLTKKEQNAIEWYVSGEGMWVNQYLRGRGDFSEISEYEMEMIKQLDKATSHYLKDTDTLYRSVDAQAIFGNMTDGEYEDLTTMLAYGENAFGKGAYAQSLVGRLKGIVARAEGKSITEKGFMSTTKDYEVARDWGDFTGSSKPVVLEIKPRRSTRGVDVSWTDANADGPGQKEVLLRRNQTLKNIRVTSRDGLIYIKADM